LLFIVVIDLIDKKREQRFQEFEKRKKSFYDQISKQSPSISGIVSLPSVSFVDNEFCSGPSHTSGTSPITINRKNLLLEKEDVSDEDLYNDENDNAQY
jgi:hypothetical protein